ncbi:MAG TPA: hypothetical protein VIE66_16590 [Methylocella sp.]|jgi:hypothetical protein
MSKKTISFQNPSNSANSPAAPGLAIHSRADLAVDQWISQPEEIVETSLASSIKSDEARRVIGSVTINVSTEPDAFEVIKIGFLVPYLAFTLWTLGAMQRSLRLFDR